MIRKAEEDEVEDTTILALVGRLASEEPAKRGPRCSEVDNIASDESTEEQVLVAKCVLRVDEGVRTIGANVTVVAINQALEHLLAALEVMLTTLAILLLRVEDRLGFENDSTDLVTGKVSVSEASTLTDLWFTAYELAESRHMA